MGLGGAASFSVKITRAAPLAPSNLDIVRVSDSQQTLNWARNSTYTSVVIQRTTGTGSSWSGWQQVGVAAGNAFTFTDKTTVPNRYYVYRVAGVGPSGQSPWSGQAGVYTTPAVPTGIKAARSSSNIVVSATSVPSYASGFDVRDGSTVIASNVSLPYTHVNPNPAVAHTYTVRAIRVSPDALASAWSSASNT
ncbi:fibronectin type III domain-containing protein, partial [Bacillus tequilensis]|nr:fibronectin type III domain-containing protein [Bacillus tequilensis]